MIAGSSSSPIFPVGSVATSVFSDYAPLAVLVFAILMSVMVIGILIRASGGDEPDFGVDWDDLEE